MFRIIGVPLLSVLTCDIPYEYFADFVFLLLFITYYAAILPRVSVSEVLQDVYHQQ